MQLKTSHTRKSDLPRGEVVMRGVPIGTPSRSGLRPPTGGTKRRPSIDPLWVGLGTCWETARGSALAMLFTSERP